MARKHVLAVLGATLALGAAAFATTASSKPTRPVADDPNNANLTYWYWGDDDAPGASLAQEGSRPLREGASGRQDQGCQTVTDTLISGVHDGGPDQERPRHRDAVGHAARADAGLEQLVRADLRLRARERDEELDRHGREHVGRQALGDAAVPARHPVRLEQGDVQEGGPGSEQGPEDLGRVPGRRQEAQGGRLHAVRLGQQGRLRRRLVLLADRQAEPELDQRVQGRRDRQGEVLRPEDSRASTRRSPTSRRRAI